MPGDLPYCVCVKPVSSLRQSERIDESHVHRLAATIRRAGTWTAPIPIETNTGIVMDGNHRLRAAAALGLRFLPCIALDYLDPRIRVTHWQTGEPFCVTAIVKRILEERDLFPYKTTRHRFAPVLPVTEIPLSVLAAP
jgi:hypothetical protein